MGEATISHKDKSIISYDMSNTRCVSFIPQKPRISQEDKDITIETDFLQKVSSRVRGEEILIRTTPTTMEVHDDKLRYELRVFHADKIKPTPKVQESIGYITIPCDSLKNVLKDVETSGADMIIMSAEDGKPWFRGEGENCECKITSPDGTVNGTGYTRVALKLLLESLPAKDVECIVYLSPKGHIKVKIGEDITYYQSALRND